MCQNNARSELLITYEENRREGQNTERISNQLIHPDLAVRFLPSKEPTIDSDSSDLLNKFLPLPVSGLSAGILNKIREISHRFRSGCPDRPARRK